VTLELLPCVLFHGILLDTEVMLLCVHRCFSV